MIHILHQLLEPWWSLSALRGDVLARSDGSLGQSTTFASVEPNVGATIRLCHQRFMHRSKTSMVHLARKTESHPESVISESFLGRKKRGI